MVVPENRQINRPEAVGDSATGGECQAAC